MLKASLVTTITAAACLGSLSLFGCGSNSPAGSSKDAGAGGAQTGGAGGNAAGTGGSSGAAGSSSGVAGTGGTGGSLGVDASASGGSGGGAALTRIEVSPPVATLAQGTNLPLTVTADYADGTSSDVSALSALSSSATAVATVAGQTVTAVGPGTATITATFMGQSVMVMVTVTAATLESISIDPSMPTLAAGTSTDLVATGVFSDGSKQDVSQLATWSSSDATVATVMTSSSGVNLTGVKAGSALVTAKLLNISASATVTVTTAVIQSIDITPSHPTIPVGIDTQFQATATYSDNSTQDVSSQVTWSASDPSIATVNTTGNVATKAMGSVTLQAALGGITGETTVIVMGTSLISIQVTPTSITVPAGIPQQFTAKGTYSDGSVVDVTQSVAWSTDGAAASVSNAAGQAGLGTGLSAGTVQVQAQLGSVTGSATFTITSAIVTSLTVQPKTATLPVGFTQVLTATATYSDATQLDVTSLAVWSSSDATVAAVSNAATGGVASGTVTAVGVGAATITASFGGASDTTQVTTTAAVITEIDVAPATATVAAGLQQTFTATAKISDGTTSDVTTQVTWSSSAPSIATISNAAGSKGLATTLAAGTATITATLGGKLGTAQLSVTGPVLQSLQVTPFTANLTVGATQAFTATAIYSDGSTANVTGSATWSVSDAIVASTTSVTTGPVTRLIATGLAAGTATVQASYSGLSASALLQVTAPVTLVNIIVTPSAGSIRVGQSQAFTAQAVYSDGSTVNVTTTAAWTSSDTTVATVGSSTTGRPVGGFGGAPGTAGPAGPAGTATGVAAGTITVTATYMTLTATAQLTVTAPLLVSLEINPPTASLIIGQSQQFQATALYDDGSRETVTTSALWSSSSPNVLAVSDATTGGGLGGGLGGGGTPQGDAVALAAGTSTVSASYSGLSATASVTVSAPTLVAVQVTPTNPTIATGATLQFEAVALYSDYSTVNVTTTASWVSGDPTLATITNTGAGRGRVTGISAGTPTITATYLGISGSTTLTVVTRQVTSIEVTPANPTVPVGINQTFTATATFTDGSTADVTAGTTWTSSDSTVVALSNATGSQGTATSLEPGSVTVTATYMGMMGSTPMTVSTASLVSIVVGGISGNLAVGSHSQLTATASYDDASTFDVTGLVTWISTSLDVATVSNALGSNGLATGVAAGTTTIEAHFEGIVGTEPLTVGP